MAADAEKIAREILSQLEIWMSDRKKTISSLKKTIKSLKKWRKGAQTVQMGCGTADIVAGVAFIGGLVLVPFTGKYISLTPYHRHSYNLEITYGGNLQYF